jgi:hypothetical protein
MALAAILLVGLLIAPATAQYTDITISPSDPAMGELLTLTAVGAPRPPYTAQFVWQWQYSVPPRSTPWTDMGVNAPTVYQPLPYPGNWAIRLTVYYVGGPPPLPNPDQVTKSIVVAPPVYTSIIEGLDTPHVFGEAILMKFQIHAASRPCGPYMAGDAQELITGQWRLVPPLPPPEYPPDWTDWYPPGGPVATFRRVGSAIFDEKNHTPDFFMVWGQIPNSTVYMKYIQRLRVRYTDYFGTLYTIDLGFHPLERKKLDANHWQYQQGL